MTLIAVFAVLALIASFAPVYFAGNRQMVRAEADLFASIDRIEEALKKHHARRNSHWRRRALIKARKGK